jgi:DNA-binding IclR family transcriptional regulator
MKTELTSVLVLAKIAKILDYLTDNKAAVSISAMSRTLGIPRATLYRLLESLAAQDIIVQRRGRYEVGSRMLTWGARALDSFSVRQVVYPHMQSLRDALDLSVSLYIRGRDCRICIESLGGAAAQQPGPRIGEQQPLHRCASGLVLSAWLPAEQRTFALEASRQRFPVAGDDLSDEGCALIQQQGWATTRSGRNDEQVCVAAPIFDDAGAPLAALLIYGLPSEFSRAGQTVETVSQRLLETVAEIHDMSARRMVA